jgi:hypothetical protein
MARSRQLLCNQILQQRRYAMLCSPVCTAAAAAAAAMALYSSLNQRRKCILWLVIGCLDRWKTGASMADGHSISSMCRHSKVAAALARLQNDALVLLMVLVAAAGCPFCSGMMRLLPRCMQRQSSRSRRSRKSRRCQVCVCRRCQVCVQVHAACDLVPCGIRQS